MATERDIFNIEKLEGSSNWQLWHMMIKTFLKGLGHFGYCIGEIEKPKEGNTAIWIKENSKVCNCILMSLGKEPLTLVMSLGDEPTAKEIWTQLNDIYNRKSAEKGANAQRKFMGYKWQDKGIMIHINDLQGFVREMRENKKAIDDGMVIAQMLQTLPAEYDNFRSIWDNKPEGEKKVDELITRLRNEEDRMNARKKGGEEEATAFLAKTRIHDKDKSSHKKACYHCKRINHLAKDCRFKNQDDSSNKKKVNKEDVQCHNCKGFGHFAKECSSKRRDNKQQNEEQNRALVGIEETAFLMVTDEKWIVDSGATKHMTPNGDWFSEYRKLESPIIIHVGKEGETVKGIGRGRIDVKLHLGNGKYTSAFLKDVIYVPEMKVNLFSTNEAANKGIGFDTLDGKFREKGKVIAQATHINQMWYMDMEIVKPEKACIIKVQKP